MLSTRGAEMKKAEARSRLVALIVSKSAEQNPEPMTEEEVNWLIDSESQFSDEDLGSMIGEQAFSVFRKLVVMIS
jgi:hypothetical protein